MSDENQNLAPETETDQEQTDQEQTDQAQSGEEAADHHGHQDLSIGQPAKLMRIGTMVKQLLDEVKSSPLDEKARVRLAELHKRSLDELKDGLSDDLVEELSRLSLPLGDDNDDEAPSEAELRVAQAQLVGWLEGLFHGLQAALMAQQMGAQHQLQQMRRGLPPGVTQQQAQEMIARAQQQHQEAQGNPDSGQSGPGQYL